MLVSRNDIIKVFGLSAGRAMYLRAHKLNLHKTLVTSYIPVTRKGKPTEQYCQMVHFDIDDLIESYTYGIDHRYTDLCLSRAEGLRQYKESL